VVPEILKKDYWTSWFLKLKVLSSFETSGSTHKTTYRHISEEQILQQQLCEKFRPHNCVTHTYVLRAFSSNKISSCFIALLSHCTVLCRYFSHLRDTYHIVGQASVFVFEIRPYPLLSAIAFHARHHLSVCGFPGSAAALDMDEYRSGSGHTLWGTIQASFVTKLYKRPVNLFSDWSSYISYCITPFQAVYFGKHVLFCYITRHYIHKDLHENLISHTEGGKVTTVLQHEDVWRSGF
jgi:hypothetical protein